jgi:hypothetical protein
MGCPNIGKATHGRQIAEENMALNTATREFIRQLRQIKEGFTKHLRYNIESPQRIQPEIREAIEFLETVDTTGDLKKHITIAIKKLNEALRNAQTVSKEIKSAPGAKDLEAIYHDESFWYQQVIGTAESAMDEITRYLNNE